MVLLISLTVNFMRLYFRLYSNLWQDDKWKKSWNNMEGGSQGWNI